MANLSDVLRRPASRFDIWWAAAACVRRYLLVVVLGVFVVSLAAAPSARGQGGESMERLAVVQENLAPAKQYTALRATVLEEADRGSFDPVFADAFLDMLTPERLAADRDLAHRTYLRLLGEMGVAAGPTEQRIYRKHAARLLPLVPEAIVRQVIRENRRTAPQAWTFHPDAGTVMQTWWRQKDPMPGTLHNERLDEHLERISFATTQYPCEHRTSGVDDRGLVYIRYGPPGRTDEVDYNDPNFRMEVFRFGVPITQYEFPSNELWSYAEIDDAGYFVFTENARQCYDLGGALDLIPDRLYQNRGRSERAENIAYSAMMALRYVYSELALFHIDFSMAYNEIESYVSFQENEAMATEAREALGGDSRNTQTQSIGSGFNQTRTISSSDNFGIPTPAGFVESMVTDIQQQDHAASYRRREVMPREATDLIRSEEVMPVAVQTARFLNPDGTTRVEIAWGLQKLHLRPLDPDAEARLSLLDFDAVQFDAAYERVDTAEQRYTIRPETLVGDDLFVSPPVVFETTADVSHFGMQWTQFDVVTDDAEEARLGERMRIGTVRTDSLRPLDPSGERLEMSDVRLMISPSGNPEDAVAFPFSTFSPETPLVLSFEVYHLAYRADDQTEYTVAYDIERRSRRGWRRLFRAADTEKTTTEVTYSGRQRRSEEFIAIDLSTLRQPETQDLRVTVRVTDTVTGDTVARTQQIQLVGTDKL